MRLLTENQGFGHEAHAQIVKAPGGDNHVVDVDKETDHDHGITEAFKGRNHAAEDLRKTNTG